MRILLSAAVILLGACSSAMQSSDPADDVHLTVAPENATPGDSMTLTLRNETTEQIGYNLCTSSLQRQTAGGWATVPSDVVCTMELRTLEPDQEASYRTALPDDLASGQYRYTTSAEAMETGGGYGIMSNTFDVDS
ncbi:MAG TPA: hypothetical protein VHG09_12110 [Longimicrobiales bacterium]|nr:hypothetical protein [Longimicrobiales bacterium]